MKRITLYTLSLVVILAATGEVALARDGFSQPVARRRIAKRVTHSFAQKAQTAKKKEPATQAQAVKVAEIDETGLKALRQQSASDGRVLLVNFWATWCTPCREEFPDLIKLRELYPPDKFDLVLISLDDISEIATGVPAFLAQTKATGMPSYLLNTTDSDAAINLFDPTWRGELPATFVYDRAGQLAYKHRGRIKPAEVRGAIETALVSKASPQPASQNPGR
jgi:thiol-disulfide isomerase/thioredoxin